MTSEESQPDGARPWMRAAHGLLAVYWLAIFTLTHVRISPPSPSLLPNADKIVHFVLYGLLAILFFTARSMVRPLMWRDYLIGMLIFAVYGVADELLQIPVGRTCDAMDWVADVTGALAGTGLFLCIGFFRRS
jgi:VanZ family protein